jgi:cytochrome P450
MNQAEKLPDPWKIPLEQINVSDPRLYQRDAWRPYFQRLREKAPVHYLADSNFGPFWSVTRFEDIVAVDSNHQVFSSEPAVIIGDMGEDVPLEMFIAMDPPEHDKQRDPSTANLPERPMEFLGNLCLLIVGGNDTTRNSITGGVLALNENPAEYDKLRADHGLIPGMISEIIRWQTPLTHMRRIAREDFELNGARINKGDKVVMWYISGNRDESAIERADEFIIDRSNPRHHVSFGFGIHRCMGNRQGEMQLRILWEEIMKRFSFVEVVGQPERHHSNFVRGYASLPVKLHAL